MQYEDAKSRFDMTARIRKAREAKRARDYVRSWIDWIFTKALNGYELPHNSRWTLFAEMFWLEPFCPICFFYRGATFGFFLGLTLAALAYIIIG